MLVRSASRILNKCQQILIRLQIKCSNSTSSSFEQQYNLSIDKPEEFWADKVDLIEWYKKPEKIFDANVSPFQKWYGELIAHFNTDRNLNFFLFLIFY